MQNPMQGSKNRKNTQHCYLDTSFIQVMILHPKTSYRKHPLVPIYLRVYLQLKSCKSVTQEVQP